MSRRKPLAGRAWFFALGQRHEGHVNYAQLKAAYGTDQWPDWAWAAYLDGRSAGGSWKA